MTRPRFAVGDRVVLGPSFGPKRDRTVRKVHRVSRVLGVYLVDAREPGPFGGGCSAREDDFEPAPEACMTPTRAVEPIAKEGHPMPTKKKIARKTKTKTAKPAAGKVSRVKKTAKKK